MFRALFVVLAVTGLSAPAGAQLRGLPLSPGVQPGSSIGPGTQFLPQSTPRFSSPVGGMSRSFGSRGAGAFGSGYYPFSNYGFGFGYGGYGGPYDYGATPPIVIQIVPPGPARSFQSNVVLANEFPATLALQFPAPADVWLNGVAVKGDAAEERVLTSPVLKPGEQFAFEVRARWTTGGKKYENTRTVMLGSGDRSRLLIVSGTEVK